MPGVRCQVVEPVAVLQLLELGLEHVVERAAQEAAEEVRDLREAADPQVDLVETGVGDAVGVVAPGRAVAEHEVGSVRRDVGIGRVGRIDDELRPRALAGERGLTRDGRVGAVGGHEVDQRLGVLEVLTEVRPAGVGRQLRVVGLGVDLPANLVERRNAGLTSPGHVERGQVERKAEQVVAERLDHELVQLVAGLIGRAHDDCTGRLLRRVEAAVAVVEELGRVQERRQQRDRVVGRAARVRRRHRNRSGAGDVVVEHRVAEAVDRVGELGLDGRVDGRVVGEERLDLRLHLACELLEHEVLVLHLGHEAGGLEEALAVPAVGRLGDRQLPLRQRGDAGRGGVVGEDVLEVVDQPVVLGMEDLVDRAERDVLVAATVAAGEVRVQHLVVVGAGGLVGEVRRRRVVEIRRRCHRRRARDCGQCPAGTGRRCARCPSGTACRSAARSRAPARGWRGCPRPGRTRSRTAEGREAGPG